MGHDQEGQRTLRRIGIGFVVGIGLLFVYLLYVSGQSAGPTDVNAIECACIARNLATTGHFASDVIKPLSLARVPVLANHPDLIYAPLHPLWEALWYKVLGNEKAISLACGAWLFLGGLLLLFLGTKWFSLRVGALAAVLYVLNPVMLDNAGGGTEAPMLGFLLLVLLALAKTYLGDKDKPLWKAAAFGAVAALLGLTKYAWGLSIIPVLIAVLYSTPAKSRLTATLAAFGAFIVVLLPWMVRNALVVGDPFFTFQYAEGLMNTRSFPGNTLYRTFTTSYPSALMFFLTSPKEALEKIRSGLGVVYPIPVTGPGIYLGALFVASLFTALSLRSFELARYVLYGAYAFCVLALLVVFPAPRLLVCIAAPATLFAVAYFDKLLTSATEKMLERARARWTIAAMVLLALVVCLPPPSSSPPAALRTPRAWSRSKRPPARLPPSSTARSSATFPGLLPGMATSRPSGSPRPSRTSTRSRTSPALPSGSSSPPWSTAVRRPSAPPTGSACGAPPSRTTSSPKGYAVYRRLPDNWILFQRVTVSAGSRGPASGAAK